jgi:hypothetical protein
MNELTECNEPTTEQPPGIIPGPQQASTENKEVPAPPSPVERHSRKCQICRHPDREDIEQDYRDWLKPSQIARRYEIDDRALYRHLRAVGLVASRRENLRVILDRILERGAEKEISGNTIIRAVRAQCCLKDGNKWVEPAKNVIYSYENAERKEESRSAGN